MRYKIIMSPIGRLKIVVDKDALIAILWEHERPKRVPLDDLIACENDCLILETEKQLREYFQKQRQVFNLPIELRGTPFQLEVWNALNQIPFGVTWSYKDMALKVGRPLAARAVGAAIGRNPISIIVPCHRVVGSKGDLTGFAGGLNHKKTLLDLESNA